MPAAAAMTFYFFSRLVWLATHCSPGFGFRASGFGF
jgi:hypothetical protein